MASLGHEHFRDELRSLIERHEKPQDRNLARSALMWLSVAQRPLRSHDLWIALQVGESKDLEHIERLVTEPGYVDAGKAASSLQDLLGGLVSLRTDPGDSGKTYVSLSDPELRTFLAHLGDDASVPGDWLSIAFSSAEAHIIAATISMIICSATTLRLAHVHDKTFASGLILYAWEHWHTHLALSRVSLDNENGASLTDAMVFSVCTDILVFLLSISDFVTGPITFPSTGNKTEACALVKQAQDLLERPIILLSAVVRQRGYSQTLQGARQIYESSKYLNNASRLGPSSEGASAAPLLQSETAISPYSVGSKVGTLRVDKALRDTEQYFGPSERQLLRAFAEASRGLRLLAVTVAQAPLYDELLKLHSSPWSPLDILVRAANWLEAVASYPYWYDIPERDAFDFLVVEDACDENYDAAALVLSRLQPSDPTKRAPPPHAYVPRTFVPPASISSTRWRVASVLDRAKSILPATSASSFTINEVRLLSRRTSSFSNLPSELQATGDHLEYLYPLIPNSLRRFYRDRIAAWAGLGIFKSLDDFSSGAFTGGLAQNWPKLKSAIVAEGYRKATVYFGIAIVLHQIRRILFPWFCSYMWYEPLEDLRLALSNPEVFLDVSLSFSWPYVVFMYGLKYICDLLAGVVMGLLIIDNGRIPPESLEQLKDTPAAIPYLERLMEVSKVGYICWVFATIEYIFARALNTVSFVIAYWKLLSGGDAEHIALGNILKEHWTRLPLNAWQLFFYAREGFWPLIWGAILCTFLGQPGLLVLVLATVAGVVSILKFRSTFFIALEVSGLFIAIGFVALTAVLLGVEFIDDPMGLKPSTEMIRKRGNKARSELPPGANSRTQILSRKTALPVVRLEHGTADIEHGEVEKPVMEPSTGSANDGDRKQD